MLSPPWGGSLSVSPSSGTMLDTVFTFTVSECACSPRALAWMLDAIAEVVFLCVCPQFSGWTDVPANLPLAYSLRAVASDGSQSPLAPSQSFPVFALTLSSTTVSVIGVVTSAVGLYAAKAVPVTVALPVAFQGTAAASAASLTSAQASLSSSLSQAVAVGDAVSALQTALSGATLLQSVVTAGASADVTAAAAAMRGVLLSAVLTASSGSSADALALQLQALQQLTTPSPSSGNTGSSTVSFGLSPDQSNGVLTFLAAVTSGSVELTTDVAQSVLATLSSVASSLSVAPAVSQSRVLARDSLRHGRHVVAVNASVYIASQQSVVTSTAGLLSSLLSSFAFCGEPTTLFVTGSSIALSAAQLTSTVTPCVTAAPPDALADDAVVCLAEAVDAVTCAGVGVALSDGSVFGSLIASSTALSPFVSVWLSMVSSSSVAPPSWHTTRLNVSVSVSPLSPATAPTGHCAVITGYGSSTPCSSTTFAANGTSWTALCECDVPLVLWNAASSVSPTSALLLPPLNTGAYAFMDILPTVAVLSDVSSASSLRRAST